MDTLQQNGMDVYEEVGERNMGNETMCEKCHSKSIINGKCANCGYGKSETGCSNALPHGHLLNNGRYRIEGVLGEGGYGITYVALDLLRKQKIAVKEFFPAYAFRRSSNKTDAVCVKTNAEDELAHIRIRFNEEAALLFSLNHIKEIVDVYHGFEDNNTAYYTMELLQGMDMQKHLQMHGRMFWHELSPIVIQILRALYATHQKGYIHRDVTPDNIFLLNNGTVQLIDFGNARRYRENQQLTAVVKDKFAPREQYSRKGKQGPWTDIYSFCVTIYYAMTGVLPPKATEISSAAESLPPLHTCVDIPQTVSQAVQRGMSVDEDRRYRSIADFAYALYPGQSVLGTLPRQFSLRRTASQTRKGQTQRFPVHQSVTMPVQRQENNQRYAYLKQSTGSSRSKNPMLVCTQGIMKGFRLNLPVGQIQTIGRDQGKLVQYPNGADGVSRNQCSVLLQINGVVYIRDDGSSYGTSVNGCKLTPKIWKPLKYGDVICFGRETYVLY